MTNSNFDELSFDEIVKFCIKLEHEAVALYTSLAAKAEDVGGKARFESLAQMERGHVQKLENMDEEGFFENQPKPIIDLKLTDYMVAVDPGKKLTTQEALILAAKREKNALDLYTALSEKYKDEPLLSGFFQMMSEEEARHKHDLETEYESQILGEM